MKNKTWANKLDKLFSYFIRERANWTCQKCGHRFPEEYNEKGQRKAAGLHTAHWKGRRLYRTRWDIYNADALCYGCHSAYGHSIWMEEHIRDKFGQKNVDRITALHNSPPKWHNYEFEEKEKELKGK